jgi:aminoglycoside 2'-N-acetyltransferase I
MNPELEVLVKKMEELTSREREELNLVDHLAFFEEDGDSDWWKDWATSEICFLGREAGKIVSNVGMITREILVGGIPVTVGGIGGVATRPDRQRQGFAAALLAESQKYMAADPVYQFGMLFCDPKRTVYYGKSGYRQMTNQVFIRRGTERHLFPDTFMVLELRGYPFPEGEVDCMGLPW